MLSGRNTVGGQVGLYRVYLILRSYSSGSSGGTCLFFFLTRTEKSHGQNEQDKYFLHVFCLDSCKDNVVMLNRGPDRRYPDFFNKRYFLLRSSL